VNVNRLEDVTTTDHVPAAACLAHNPVPDRERLADVLIEALERVTRHDGIGLALQIEHECAVATGVQACTLLADPRLVGLGLVWDPGNEAHRLGRQPDPEPIGGQRDAILHVHVKDVDPDRAWVRVGTGVVDWATQLRRLAAIGYDGHLSVETLYALPIPAGTAAATTESVAELRALCAARPGSN
jgi:sugar phosphate isomerase/epimerase